MSQQAGDGPNGPSPCSFRRRSVLGPRSPDDGNSRNAIHLCGLLPESGGPSNHAGGLAARSLSPHRRDPERGESHAAERIQRGFSGVVPALVGSECATGSPAAERRGPGQPRHQRRSRQCPITGLHSAPPNRRVSRHGRQPLGDVCQATGGGQCTTVRGRSSGRGLFPGASGVGGVTGAAAKQGRGRERGTDRERAFAERPVSARGPGKPSRSRNPCSESGQAFQSQVDR